MALLNINCIIIYVRGLQATARRHGRPHKFFQGGNVENLLMLFRLLTMQYKWTFTKRITLSTPLVCAGCTSILNLLSKMFSTLWLSEILFLFISCPISIFEHVLQIVII